MRTVNTLVEFGPDSRAVCDWLAASIGLAYSEQTAENRSVGVTRDLTP